MRRRVLWHIAVKIKENHINKCYEILKIWNNCLGTEKYNTTTHYMKFGEHDCGKIAATNKTEKMARFNKYFARLLTLSLFCRNQAYLFLPDKELRFFYPNQLLRVFFFFSLHPMVFICKVSSDLCSNMSKDSLSHLKFWYCSPHNCFSCFLCHIAKHFLNQSGLQSRWQNACFSFPKFRRISQIE